MLFLIYPIPETGIPVFKSNVKFWIFNREVLKEISMPMSDYDLKNEFVIDVFDNLVSEKIKKIKPKSLFCNVDIKIDALFRLIQYHCI